MISILQYNLQYLSAPSFEEVFERLRKDGNTSIPYSKTVGAIKATNVREQEVAWITVQKMVSVQSLMKEMDIVPYVLPSRRELHKKVTMERLTSSEDESLEQLGYHKGSQITPDSGTYNI